MDKDRKKGAEIRRIRRVFLLKWDFAYIALKSKKTMKKYFLIPVLFAGLLASCGEKSKKGAWIQADKDKFVSECMKGGEGESIPGMDAAAMDKFKKDVCDCAVVKAEAEYENFEGANGDEPGMTKIGEACGTEIAMKMLEDLMKNMPEEVTTGDDTTVTTEEVVE